ncbi:MAG TPA: tail fiber protein [Allosphingosinicella sp.]|jgi:microcystin-dependent protein
MAQPYIGEIRMFAGNFPPNGWLFCSGQQLSIAENEALFQLIGTTYGGDGQETFNLPNLQSRIPIHQGQGSGLTNHVIGELAGTETVTLTTQQMPSHTHPLIASANTADTPNVANGIPAAGTVSQLYWGDPPDTVAAPQAIAPQGGSQPHDNCQSFLCVNYIISLFGIFPSPT